MTRRLGGPLDEVDAPIALAVCRHGVVRADGVDEVDQQLVDLVLQHRRAGGGTSTGDVAPVEHDDVEPSPGEFESDQTAGDPGADHDDVAPFVGGQRRVDGEDPVTARPERGAVVEVHLIMMCRTPDASQLAACPGPRASVDTDVWESGNAPTGVHP